MVQEMKAHKATQLSFSFVAILHISFENGCKSNSNELPELTHQSLTLPKRDLLLSC